MEVYTSMEAPMEVWKSADGSMEVWKYGSAYGSAVEVWKCRWKYGSASVRKGWDGPFRPPYIPGRAVLSVSIIRTFELSHFACSVYLVTLCLQAPRVYKAEQWRCTCGYEMRFIPTRICHCYALIRHPSIRGLEQRLRPTPAGTRPVRAETRI